MPFDALGNYIPDDEELSLDAMKYELAKRGTMPLRPDGSDVPYLASEVPSLRVPITPKDPPKPYSTATNFPQAVADRLGISAIPQALMAMGTGFASEVAKGIGQKEASEAMRYEPTSRVASDVLAGLEEAPKAITGSHMGFGPMPETWVTGMGSISPNDVRVIAKRGIETGRELRAIPEDFRNAQSGLRRESNLGGETYGAKLQGVAEDIGDVMARQEARRNRYETYPKSSVEVFGDMIPDSKLYAVRNTGEGQMLRPTTSLGGVEPRGVDYGETEQFLREASPALSVNKPEDIIDMYERTYMSENTPAVRKLNEDWERFQTDKIKEMYPSHFSKAESFKALRSGYPANVIQDMKLKWFHDYIAQKKAEGFEIPSMEEYYARAQAAHSLTKKIIPNIIQKYLGTPTDPFLESAKQGFTMTPADEFVSQYLDTPSSLEKARREAGFEPKGEVADKLMPVAESKLATQNAELDKLIADQSEIGRTEGMMIPYPDGRVDPETGAVELATNPNYAQYTNKIKAMRKVIEDTEQEVNNLKLAQAYENVADSSIKTGTATDYRNRIPAEFQQFYPALYSEKDKTTAISPTTYKTPDTAPFFETNLHGLSRAGILPLTVQLVNKIMSGEIPPDQVPNLSQPHTITKYMKDIVAPRIEKEKAARLAMKDYKVNVEKHFVDVVNAIPDSMRVGTNAKLLWIDDATPEAEINQHLSDATFILDHCIGNSGHGGGLKNLFTGDERSYIPFMDPATGQKFKNAGGTSSYMDAVLNGEKDIMMILDDKTGMHVGTIELSRDVDKNGEVEYQVGYVSGYKNHSNKFKGIDPKYREALRDSLNMVKDEIASSSGNETQSGVYDMRSADQLGKLSKALKLPAGSYDATKKIFDGIKKNIMDNLDGDRYITLEQAEEAYKQYKADNPPVPAVRSGFPPSGKDVIERNIIMQGLSRENLEPTRQFNAARMVGSQDGRFLAYPTAQTEMDTRPFVALTRVLDSERARSNNAPEQFSDYQLFRNLQNMVDAIDQGDMRFADFNLGGHSELLDLREGLQKQADAVGQLAHYADVLQRNGYRSPLPSEQTGAPEWNTYQRYIGELGIDNPRDLRTRLRDTIEHADLREIDPQLDEIQRENLRQLLEIHIRAVEQAENYPAPTAPAQQRGIPLAQWTDLVGQTMDRIQVDHGQTVRDRVAGILAEAIGSQMDIPVNERPNQVSSYLANARSANNSQQVRRALGTLGSAIDQANADILNARNAPATPALPSLREYGEALRAAEQDIPANIWSDVSVILGNIQNEIVRNGGMYHQHPATIVQRLNDEADYQEGEGEPDTATGLRNLAGEIARLVPANPPASMALANQQGRQLVAGQEALSNSILDAMQDYPSPEAISDRLRALQWRENLVDDPAGLMRNIRIEADAEANAGNEQFATSLYDIANLIADENGETLFTPAGRQVAEPRRTPRDIAETASAPAHQTLTQRIAQIDALANAINEEIRSIPEGEVHLRQAELFYSDPNNLPASIIDYTHQFNDAERIANYLLQHVRARLQNRAPADAGEFDRGLARVAEEIANTYTGNYIQQFNAGDVDVRNSVLQDVSDRPSVYGMARISPAIQRQIIEHLRTEGLPQLTQLPMETATANFPDAEQLRTITRGHTNEFTGSADSFRRIARDIRDMTPEDRLNALDRMVRDTSRNAGLDEGMRTTYGVDSPAGMTQLNNALIRLREDLRDRDLLNQLQAPSPANDLYNAGRINGVIHNRMMTVNQESLGISQRFDEIVRAALQEFNPVANTEGFISSLNYRAGSVARNGDNEGIAIAQQLHQLANDVRSVINEQAPALPAPDPIQADLDRLYNSVSESIRTRHPTMIDSVMNSRNTRSNLADVIRTDPIRYGLENYSPDVVNQVVERIIEDGLSSGQLPAPVERPRALRRVALGNEPDPVAQHFDRVEQGVNQPQGLGALDRNDSDLLRMQTTNFLNGDQNALRQLSPVQREMAEVLTRAREVEPTLINELSHRRLINTLVSQTYNPATDGEALIRLAETRSGMFADAGDAQREQIIDIVNKWNFTRFPNYRPPEEGMGLEPEGRKRGGYIRKMNDGGQPPKLSPYEQFKIDNAERIRQGQEDIANRNKYDPYKGSDQPVNTPKAPRGASGSAGVIPSGSGPSSLDRPRLYAMGGQVYMEIGGQVKPVPNIPSTPEKTRPNTTDHVIKRPVDEGFREIYEKYRNPPKPSGSAGTMPSGSGASYLDRPHLYADGGNVNIDAMRLALMKG